MRCVRVTLSTLSRSKPSRMFSASISAMPPDVGRRAGDDARAAVVADHRRALDHLVVSQVLERPVAAELAHAVDELLREIALVEPVGAFVGEQLEAGGELGLPDDVAELGHLAVHQVHARGVGRLEEGVFLELHAAAQPRVQRKTIARQPDGGRHADRRAATCRISSPGARSPRARRECRPPAPSRATGPESGCRPCRGTCRARRHRAPFRAGRSWSRGRRWRGGSGRTRRRRGPSSRARPPRAPPRRPPPRRRHCRPWREFPCRRRWPVDRRWRWRPCPGPRAGIVVSARLQRERQRRRRERRQGANRARDRDRFMPVRPASFSSARRPPAGARIP